MPSPSTRRRSRPRRLLLALTALGLVLAGCDANGDDDAADAGNGEEVSVSVLDNEFDPPEVTVNPGDTVVWSFDGEVAHNVTFDDLDVASDTTDEGTFQWTADEPGEYAYTCTIHAGMDGTVVVDG